MKLDTDLLRALTDEQSATKIAAMAGVHIQTIYRAINGKRLKPKSHRKLVRLLRSYRVGVKQ